MKTVFVVCIKDIRSDRDRSSKESHGPSWYQLASYRVQNFLNASSSKAQQLLTILKSQLLLFPIVVLCNHQFLDQMMIRIFLTAKAESKYFFSSPEFPTKTAPIITSLAFVIPTTSMTEVYAAELWVQKMCRADSESTKPDTQYTTTNTQ